jgi:hypothetical protein
MVQVQRRVILLVIGSVVCFYGLLVDSRVRRHRSRVWLRERGRGRKIAPSRPPSHTRALR